MAFQYWRQKPDPEPRRTRFLALGRRLPRRHARRRQRRRGRAVPRDVRPAALPGPPGPEPALLPLPARPGAARRARPPASTRSSGSWRPTRGEVAAVVVEPLVQGAAGMIVHPEGYLTGLRDLTRAARHAADRRRGGRRLRPDRDALRLRAGGRRARLPLPGQGADRRLPAPGRDPDDRGGLLRLLRHGRRRQDLLSRPHLRREPARRGGRPGELAGLRRRADARTASRPRSPAWPSGSPSSPALPARRRRPPARPDRGHRAGRRQGDEGPLSLGRAGRRPGLPPGPRPRPADPAAGRRPRRSCPRWRSRSSNSTRCSTS